MAKLSVNDSIEAFVDCVYDAVCYVGSEKSGEYPNICLINPETQKADPLYSPPPGPIIDFFSCGGEHGYVEPELARWFRNIVLDEYIRVKREGRLDDRDVFRNYLLRKLDCCFIRTLLNSNQDKGNQLLLELS